MQRKNTVKAKCVQHELHLSFVIIPSGSRISSSCNKDKSGSSKQEFSWLLQGLGDTCGKWVDLAWWHHVAIINNFVWSLLLFLRQLSNHSGALGVRGMGERFTLCYVLSVLRGATDIVCSVICFSPTHIAMIPPPLWWSFQGKETFSLTLSFLTLTVCCPTCHLAGPSRWGLSPSTEVQLSAFTKKGDLSPFCTTTTFATQSIDSLLGLLQIPL